MALTRGSFWRSLWRRAPLRGGLARRILRWFLVLSLAPLLVSNTVGYLYTREIIDRQIRQYLKALAETQAQQVAKEVDRHQLFLRGIAMNLRLQLQARDSAAMPMGRQEDTAFTALQAHLAHELREIPSLSELFVIDSTGTVIAATRSDRLGEDWSQRWLLRRGRIDDYFDADWDVEGGEVVPLYLLAVPIQDGQRTIGVLGGSVGFERHHAFLNVSEHLASDVHAFILDRFGRPVFISHPHRPVDYRKRLPSPLVDERLGAAVRYVNYEGIEVLGISVPIAGVPWSYISEVSVASALGQLRGLALLAAALESVFALLLVAVVWMVARSIVAPLRRLVSAAERIRKGDLGIAVAIERDDELGDLGRTFDQMSGELKASAQELQELHEQDMRRAAQLASVGELASGIAHEIKNPLIGVASGVDLLARRVEADPKTAVLLDQIHAQIRRIESAITDLLSYATPKEPLLTWTDPELLVKRLIALVHPQADAAGVQLVEQRAGDLSTIRVDPELFTQALVNLALNAIQAMKSGGVLRIGVESVDGNVRISISDTGPGIAPDEVERIYRPFYTTKHRGTGLGLAITRGIVERHGGRIELESELGRGSTFTLVIPAKRQEAPVL